MPKEIFDRIDLPSFSEIPEYEDINAEKDQVKKKFKNSKQS